jgi:hypothetical protein
VKNQVAQWPYSVLGCSGEGPLAPSRAGDTRWTENEGGTLANRGR